MDVTLAALESRLPSLSKRDLWSLLHTFSIFGAPEEYEAAERVIFQEDRRRYEATNLRGGMYYPLRPSEDRIRLESEAEEARISDLATLVRCAGNMTRELRRLYALDTDRHDAACDADGYLDLAAEALERFLPTNEEYAARYAAEDAAADAE